MRQLKRFTWWVMLFVGVSLSACSSPAVYPTVVAPSPTGVTSIGSLSLVITMNERRASHTATLLPDGTVLLAGGFQEDGRGRELSIASAEIYDPTSGQFRATGSLREARNSHTATLLPDGTVLLAGGWGSDGRLASAELYDSTSGQFRATGSLSTPREGMTATLLNDGTVLIAGGYTPDIEATNQAWVYE